MRRSNRSRPKRSRYGDNDEKDTFTSSLERNGKKQKTKMSEAVAKSKEKGSQGSVAEFAIPASSSKAAQASGAASPPASPSSRRPTVPSASKKRKEEPGEGSVTFTAIPKATGKTMSSLVSMMNPLGGGASGAAVRHPRASPPVEAFPKIRSAPNETSKPDKPHGGRIDEGITMEAKDHIDDEDDDNDDSDSDSGTSSNSSSESSGGDSSDESDESDTSSSEDDLPSSSSSVNRIRHDDLDAAARLLLSVSPRIHARPRSLSHLEPLESLAGLASLDGGQLSRASGSLDKLHVVLSGLSRGRQVSYGSLASFNGEYSLYSAVAPQSFLLGQAARKSENAKKRRRESRKRQRKTKKVKHARKSKGDTSASGRETTKSKKKIASGKEKPAKKKKKKAESDKSKKAKTKIKKMGRSKFRKTDAEMEAELAARSLGEDAPANPECPPSLMEKFGKIYNRYGRIGIFTREQRLKILARYRAKRKNRVWKKTVRYNCRKNLADTRLRIKGRFVRRDSEQAKAYFAKLKADLVSADFGKYFVRYRFTVDWNIHLFLFCWPVKLLHRWHFLTRSSSPSLSLVPDLVLSKFPLVG